MLESSSGLAWFSMKKQPFRDVARTEALERLAMLLLCQDPGGPFRTTHTNVTMPGSGKIGDFNIFVDDDGVAYHVRTGFDIVRLNANFTGPTTLVASFQTPKRSEGPTMFKRNGYYYVTAGTVCCACVGGASIYVLASPNIAGPYHYLGDVGMSQAMCTIRTAQKIM